MHLPLSLDPTLGFLAGIAISLLVILALEVYNSRRVTKLTAPIYEFAAQRAQMEAERILREAKEQARKITAEAEAASMALSSSHQKDHEDAERAFQSALKSMLDNWQARVGENAKAAADAQLKLSEKETAALQQEAEAAHTHLSSALTALEDELRKRLEKEVAEATATAREETTKLEQLHKAAIDTHIFALIRETLRITLQRELPKETHAELVRAALEEAKANGVF